MKAKSLILKYTKDYLLLIDEEAEICQMDLYLDVDCDTVTRATLTSDQYEGCKKVIAYYPLSKEAKELDLPLLPNPFEEINIEDLSEKADDYACYGRPLGEKYLAFKKGFIEGYKTAQSEQFSLEDMKNILEEGLNWFGGGRDKEIKDSETWFNHYIQLLSTQQLPSEFIPEYININSYGSETNGYDSGNFILKTITNSEGKEEIQGTYKY